MFGIKWCDDTFAYIHHFQIHALSLRRSVAGRTKPLDQLLGERRLFKEALRNKHELQRKSKPLDETTAAPVQATSNVETRQNPPVSDVGLSPSEGSSVSCLPSSSSANQLFTRPPRPRPKPQFRTSLFRSSKWFSVLAPAVGSTEKQITRYGFDSYRHHWSLV